MYDYICMHVCIICMSTVVCMYVCMYLGMYVCMHVRMLMCSALWLVLSGVCVRRAYVYVRIYILFCSVYLHVFIHMACNALFV